MIRTLHNLNLEHLSVRGLTNILNIHQVFYICSIQSIQRLLPYLIEVFYFFTILSNFYAHILNAV